MKHHVKKGVIYCRQGIPAVPRWASDGRLAFAYDETAITRIDYTNAGQQKGNHTIFLQRLWDGFRYYLETDLLNYKPEFCQTEVWPFGVCADWSQHGAVYKHRILAIQDSVVIQMETPDGVPDGTYFKFEFYEYSQLVPCDSNDFRFNDRGAGREWREWHFDEEGRVLIGGFTETPIDSRDVHREVAMNSPFLALAEENRPSYQSVVIGADFKIDHTLRPLNTKHVLRSSAPLQANRTYTLVISFDSMDGENKRKNQAALDAINDLIERQFARYRRVATTAPVLKSPYKDLNDIFLLYPLYHESLKIPEKTGAIKAKTEYWIFGWDGMTSSYAALYWGDAHQVRDALAFYEETADAELGIGHGYRNNMKADSICALPAQGMYIALLQQYYEATADLETVRARYPFARSVFLRIAGREAPGLGLCIAPSIFPDFPLYMEENGNDLSGLNNTIFYCAARSMEALAELMGDMQTRDQAEQIFRRIEANYASLFFDDEKGFVVSSVDAASLQRRDSYNSNAVKWENSYLMELMEPLGERCLEFFEKHIVSPAGLREIPAWCDAYDQDSNQLHCWWPVTGEYYMRLINSCNRRDLIEQWIGWVSYWTRKLMCPEGISCYTQTSEPELDRWNTLSGTWCAYSMRGWYQAAIHGVFGLDMDAGGLTFYPRSGPEMNLKGFHYAGHRLNLEMAGSGPYLKSVTVDGREIIGTNKLPCDLFGKKHVEIRAERTEKNPHPVFIKHAYGLYLSRYCRTEGKITALIRGLGTGRIRLQAVDRPEASLAGEKLAMRFDPASGAAWVELRMPAGEEKELEIAW